MNPPRACCGATAARLVPFDCFQRGLATRRLPPLPVAGARIGTCDLWAAFSLRVRAGRSAEWRFDCATCTTLIACCQALAECNAGCPLAAPCIADGAALWRALPGLAASKRDRADLAVAALRAAVARARTPIFTPQENA